MCLQIPNFLLTQVRRLNDSSRRYQFYDRRIKNLLKKISTDSRDKPDKNSSEVSVCAWRGEGVCVGGRVCVWRGESVCGGARVRAWGGVCACVPGSVRA